jgi:hypothetical protein
MKAQPALELINGHRVELVKGRGQNEGQPGPYQCIDCGKRRKSPDKFREMPWCTALPREVDSSARNRMFIAQ